MNRIIDSYKLKSELLEKENIDLDKAIKTTELMKASAPEPQRMEEIGINGR